MTIIQPNRSGYKINFSISILALMLMVSIVWGVFVYNQLVSFRHEVSGFEKIVRQAEVENAELKNTLYQITDLKNLESSASSGRLVLEKNPKYLGQQQPLAQLLNQ